jgi:hypothetical protein
MYKATNMPSMHEHTLATNATYDGPTITKPQHGTGLLQGVQHIADHQSYLRKSTAIPSGEKLV